MNENKDPALSVLRAMIEPLIVWYGQNQKPLPWRKDSHPYHVWLSEIMLQQTRTAAVIPYYESFLEAYPTVRQLADAPEEALMKRWEGLGYYSRARNLHKAAKVVCRDFGGQFPADHKALLSLPGVGAYTAGAIGSIAFGLPTPAVDGNVLRVLMRLLSDPSDIAEEATRRRVGELLAAVYPSGEDAGLLTQSLMELGENICIPVGRPRCIDCPLAALCRGLAENTVDSLPRKSPKKPRHIEPRTVFMLEWNGTLAIRRRPKNGLLAGLWELPSADGHLSADEAQELLAGLGLVVSTMTPTNPATHIFTHKEWHMQGFRVTLAAPPRGFVTASREALARTYAIPRAFLPFITLFCKE